jgi:O-methyltransferase
MAAPFSLLNEPIPDYARQDVKGGFFHSRMNSAISMHNTFLAELFDWDTRESELVGRVNRILRRCHVRHQIRRAMNFYSQMTTVEQRINMFHLLSQVLCLGVKGEVVELGCFEGKTAVLFQKVIEHYAPDRTLHLYDSFQMKAHVKGSVKEALLGNFKTAGARPPIIHEGRFELTVPAQLPNQVCFAHIDCGQGGDVTHHKKLVLFCLEHVYARMTPLAICLLMDYCDHSLVGAWDCNPGVKLACDEFFKGKSESISVLYGGEYCHGYFRKNPA